MGNEDEVPLYPQIPSPNYNAAYQQQTGFPPYTQAPNYNYGSIAIPVPIPVIDPIDGAAYAYYPPPKEPIEPGYKDVFWTVLYVLHLIGLIILLGFGINSRWYEPNSGPTNHRPIFPSSDSDLQLNIFYIILLSVVVSALWSGLWLVLVQKFTKVIVIGSLVISIGLWLVISIYSFAAGYVFSGMIFSLFFILVAMMFLSWRRRVDFTITIMHTVTQIIREYPATILFAFFFLLLQAIWSFIWILAVIVAQEFDGTDTWGFYVLLLFSFYWTSSLLRYMNHTTISGTIASWWFLGSPSNPNPGVPPEAIKNPTVKSFVRASTTSFGSLCLGSLLIGIVQSLRELLYYGRSQGGFCTLCADCCLSCIESLIRFFNRYIFVQIAIYGKSYKKAAKDTFELISRHGFDAIMNDNFSEGIVIVGCLLGALLSGFFGYILAHEWLGKYAIEIGFAAGIVGFTITLVTLEVISSGVTAFFVCFAMDQQPLARKNPELHRQLITTYFQV